MADEGEKTEEEKSEGKGGGGEITPPPKKCEECAPGLPLWMATFSDLVTLLLTFFVLLLSFAKTETAKYDAALGSIRNAFGGNVLKHGEVIQRGKSPDNSPKILESSDVIKPFPIDFLTMEGLLDKHEVNRGSDEDLQLMKNILEEQELADAVQIEETPEGIKVRLKDPIYFRAGTIEIEKISVEPFERMIKLLVNESWHVFVEGHSSRKEESLSKDLDAYALSAERAMAVTRVLLKRGVNPSYVSTVFYGDTRPTEDYGKDQALASSLNRRVEFLIRKVDLRSPGHQVPAQQ